MHALAVRCDIKRKERRKKNKNNCVVRRQGTGRILCVVAAGRVFGHAWMAVEPRGATGAKRQRGQFHVGDGGYLGGTGWRPVSWQETTYRPHEKGPVSPQVAHLSVINPNPEDNDLR